MRIQSQRMSPRKSAEFYSDEEIKKIEEQWRADRARIDCNPVFGYYYDQDKEYERYLNNANLRALFRHVAYLVKGLKENTVSLYPREISLVAEIYKKVIKDGYYSRSKIEEKKKRAWLGKAVSRQYFHRYGRK